MFKLLLEIFANIDRWGKKGRLLATLFVGLVLLSGFLVVLKQIGLI